MIIGITYRLGQINQRVSYAARNAGQSVRWRLERNGHRPSITGVIVGRNDDYMPDFIQRLHATMDWNLRHILGEVIFIEWNPPADRELLSFDLAERFERLRAYVVPSEIHSGLCENARLALMEYHAKNVGIRRAAARWVIATNADVALGFDTIRTLYGKLGSSGVAWTAQRVDIKWTESRERGIGLADCLSYRRIIPYNELGTGDFLLASREMWERVQGYDESLVSHRIGCDARGAAQMMAHGAELRRAGNVLHLAHPTSCTEQIQPHHGERASTEGLPYTNSDAWGLGQCAEREIAERVWRLE